MEVLCEYLKNPLGIDMEAPVFSWIVENFANGEKQTAYRVQVSKDMEFKENVVWDSQDVESEETANIPYEGLALESAEVYYYRIIVKTSQGRKLVSETGRMCTGLIGKEWDADFIGGSLMERHTFWFRHEFSLSKAVKKAIVYIASPNYYVFTVNGRKVTDAVLNNAWTDPV